MTQIDEPARLAQLHAAEARGLALLAAIEAANIVAPGRSEVEVDADIATLAERDFGVARHWHKRLVRTGLNTLCVFADQPPERIIGEDDTVYLDLGPVFGEWEADVGNTYAAGADLYAFACGAAEKRGYIFGGQIAGHTIGEFPHLTWPGERAHQLIWPANTARLDEPDGFGRARHWIVEVHLVAADRSFGGFYERLLRRT